MLSWEGSAAGMCSRCTRREAGRLLAGAAHVTVRTGLQEEREEEREEREEEVVVVFGRG